MVRNKISVSFGLGTVPGHDAMMDGRMDKQLALTRNYMQIV